MCLILFSQWKHKLFYSKFTHSKSLNHFCCDKKKLNTKKKNFNKTKQTKQNVNLFSWNDLISSTGTWFALKWLDQTLWWPNVLSTCCFACEPNHTTARHTQTHTHTSSHTHYCPSPNWFVWARGGQFLIWFCCLHCQSMIIHGLTDQCADMVYSIIIPTDAITMIH